jgi:Mg/Co/Ni transporter MgtE
LAVATALVTVFFEFDDVIVTALAGTAVLPPLLLLSLLVQPARIIAPLIRHIDDMFTKVVCINVTPALVY